MQLKRIKWTGFWALLFCSFWSSAQNITDTELGHLADSLVRMVSGKMAGKNIAIAEFVDIDGKPSDLGKYLAEEFTSALINQAQSYNVIDRSQLKYLIEEAKIGDIGMVNPESVQALGHLEGVNAVVYGKIVPLANTVKIFIRVVLLEKQVGKLTTTGHITRTPTINRLLNVSKKENVETEDNKIQPFIYGNYKISLLQCKREGSFVRCEFQILNMGSPDNIYIRSNQSRLTGGGGYKNYYVAQLSANNKVSSIQISQTLRTNESVILNAKFSNVPENETGFSKLEINCYSPATFDFIATFNNVKIN